METPIPRNGQRAELSEIEIQRAVLELLQWHPRVAWAHRMNTGGAVLNGRTVLYGFKGCADILGQLKTGELLAVEIKRASQDLSKEQLEFLELVAKCHGLAIIACSHETVAEILNTWHGSGPSSTRR